ncbi:hypothetical protein [Pseudomonas viridiflava]|uniref:hypothetical protein n=1 Tax=Pseudomonas viridiflava TaxID=33069 RepID=UPI000F04346A|nr:hypothetical protein [Pseudomonas viridiflava]
MAQEWVMILGPMIGGALTLCGVALNSRLTRRAALESAKRADRLSTIRTLEERYLTVQTTLELFIRSPTRGTTIDKELASLNAVLTLFADKTVEDSFKKFSLIFLAYQQAYERSDKDYLSPADACEDFKEEWDLAMSNLYNVSRAMRVHLRALRSHQD